MALPRRIQHIIAVPVLASLGGCSEKPAPPPPPPRAPVAKPLEVAWKAELSGPSFTIAGGEEHGSVRTAGSKIEVSLELMKGATYELDGKHGVIDADRATIDLDRSAQLGRVVEAELDHVDTGLALALVLPDGRRGTTKLPPLGFSLAAILEPIDRGPITFGDEPKDLKPADAIYYRYQVLGKAGPLEHIDFVATDETLPAEKGRKTCRGYDGNHPTLRLVLKATEVTIWNRRTGAVVAKKTFAPDTECPLIAIDREEQEQSADGSRIQSWLKSRLRG